MLKIRLQRFGRKNCPSFRVVLTNSLNSTKSGKFIEILGSYNLRTKEVKLNAEKIKERISHGAKTSVTMHNLLVKNGIIADKKIPVFNKRKSTKSTQKA